MTKGTLVSRRPKTVHKPGTKKYADISGPLSKIFQTFSESNWEKILVDVRQVDNVVRPPGFERLSMHDIACAMWWVHGTEQFFARPFPLFPAAPLGLFMRPAKSRLARVVSYVAIYPLNHNL